MPQLANTHTHEYRVCKKSSWNLKQKRQKKTNKLTECVNIVCMKSSNCGFLRFIISQFDGYSKTIGPKMVIKMNTSCLFRFIVVIDWSQWFWVDQWHFENQFQNLHLKWFPMCLSCIFCSSLWRSPASWAFK